MKLAAVTTALVSTLVLTAGTARADHDIDELAFALQRQSAAVAHDVYYNFRHAHDFRHLYSDAYEMYRLAEHVHEIAHDHGSLRHLRSDVEQLDKLFHHFEELVDEVGHDSLPLPGVHDHGWHGHYGHGVSSRSLRRLQSRMDAMEHTLHELREYVNAPVGIPPLPVPPPSAVPVLPPASGPFIPSAGRPVFRASKGGVSFSLLLK